MKTYRERLLRPNGYRLTGQKQHTPPRFRKEDLTRLGRILRQQRTDSGLTLRGLAERSGISAGAIRAMESGGSNPSLTTVMAVVEALGLSVDALIEAVSASSPRVAVVTRAAAGDKDLSEGLAGNALSARIVDLPAKALRPAAEVAVDRPSFGMVTAGEVLATTATGERVRLDTGDAYHAQPAQVQTLAGGRNGPARLIQVVDLRPDRGRSPQP
jgi:transcriptional regulator with XRE-family HTH domain